MQDFFGDELARRLDLGELSFSERQLLTAAFDSDFYLEQYPELRGGGVSPFVHYMTIGWRECRDPSPQFRTLDYLLSHRDALRSGTNPFIRWVLGDRTPEQSHQPSLVDIQQQTQLSPTTQLPLAENDWALVPDASVLPVGCESLSHADIARIREAFDTAYYLQHNPDVLLAAVDPFQHYMSFGWKELRDPSPTFCTNFYLSYYPDIKESGANPLIHWVLHGIKENRAGMSFRQKLALRNFNKMVSAIVPNYNHSKYLSQRLESILNQSYDHISITILDDCSTDNSREIIDHYVEKYPGRIRAVYNDKNSGGVFRQWRKGVLETEGDLIWLCESDDFCEPDFVEKLVPYFSDDSVQMAFGRILETDAEGRPNLELDEYREFSEPGIWGRPLVRPAAAWFSGAFGVRNVIANVGGCIWRRAPISDSVWDEAGTYRVVGDWYLYVQIASGGQIAWDPEAVSYFRRHGANTSSSSFRTPNFYRELERLMLALRTEWDIPTQTVRRFHQKIVEQYEWFGLEPEHGPLEKHCRLDKLLAARRKRPHVLIAMYGFIPGGGENFPIFLANGLVEAGWKVSMLIFETSEVNMHMRRSLNPAVSVYDASWIVEYGADRFLRDGQISLIHSHTVGAEIHFFYFWRIDTDVRFLVTLHGSYEASALSAEILETITSQVDHFIYTADKNLLPLVDLGISDSRFTKLANAMPIDPEPFPKTRSEQGIPEDAIVFTLVARGIKRKGWRAAIEAFIKCRNRHPNQPMHLCLVGEGEEPDRHKRKYGADPDISFLGYQARINGLYRVTDVAVVPTRFSGESYPLCIIQALQVGTPVIGSDVGEIRSMLVRSDGVEGGLIIDAQRDTKRFIADLAAAMERMLDESLRRRLAEGAQELGHDYDMERLVQTYGDLYNQVLGADDRDSNDEPLGPLSNDDEIDLLRRAS